jgi:hypothetical protein
MQRGSTIRVTGQRCFTGMVLAVSDIAMVIEEAPGLTVTLRRDPASTRPLQWQCQGIPCEVYIAEVHTDAKLADFRKRLRDLERRTRDAE